VTREVVEALKAVEKSRSFADKIEKALVKISLPEGGLDAGNLTRVSEVLREAGLEDIVGELVEKGVMKKPTPLDPRTSQQLRRILENLYRPLLQNYPTPMGKIYLYYQLYLQQEENK